MHSYVFVSKFREVMTDCNLQEIIDLFSLEVDASWATRRGRNMLVCISASHILIPGVI